MKIYPKKLSCLLSLFSLLTATAHADNIGQTIQIHTNFASVAIDKNGRPAEWLLILRDVTTGQVLPYLYPMQNTVDYFIALTWTHSYRITLSEMKWGPYAKIKNYCGLQDGIISGQSLFITLKGNLTPVATTSECHVGKYKDMPLPIVK